MKKALISCIAGQHGSYLAELLFQKDYEVHGLIRRASTFYTGRIGHLHQDPHHEGARLFLYYGYLVDSRQLTHLIYQITPKEVYELGVQSHAMVGFEMPGYRGAITAFGRIRLLETIRKSGVKTKFY